MIGLHFKSPDGKSQYNKSQLTASVFATFHLYCAINGDNLCRIWASAHISAIISNDQLETIQHALALLLSSSDCAVISDDSSGSNRPLFLNFVKSSHCLLLSKYSGKDIADSAISRIAYDNYNSRPQSTAVENINVLVWRFRWVWFLLSHKSEQKYFVFSFYALNKQIEQWCGTKNLGLLCLFKWMLEMVCYWPLWNLIVSNYQ